MKIENLKIGSRVAITSDVMDLATRKWRKTTERGTVYRIDDDCPSFEVRAAVMPDSWAKEGKRSGLLRHPLELTPIR